MRRIELNVYELCEEIDLLQQQIKYYKELYEEERNRNVQATNERLADAQCGVANALLFCLSVKDNEDGSLSIDKESRKFLAESIVTE